MQGIGILREANSRQFNEIKMGLAAFVVALILHLLMLSLEFPFESMSEPLALTPDNQLSVKIYKEEEHVRPNKPELENELAPEATSEPTNEKISEPETVQDNALNSDQPLQNKKLTDQLIESEVLVEKNEYKDPEFRVPSINSQNFKIFLQQENERALSDNGVSEDEFSTTFIAPAKPVIKDKKRDTGPLDGGNYKVVKNGIECESLVQIPQTFDEVTGVVPLLSGTGNCRDLNKKIDLLDKDGKIKNSERYDWN